MACVIKNNNLKMQKKDWVNPNLKFTNLKYSKFNYYLKIF